MSVVARGEYTVSPLADGATGRGVSSVVSQYAVSTSKTTAPSDASFSTNRPTWEPGKYVWTRSLITYTSGSPATSTTTPIVSSEWEAVNEVQVGGRNLWLKSSAKDSFDGWSVSYGTKTLDSTVLLNGEQTIKFVKTSASAGGMNRLVATKLEANTIFTYSFMVKSSVSVPVHNGSLAHMQVVGTSDGTNVHREQNMKYYPNPVPANKWTKVSVTFNTPIEAVAGETFEFRSFLWYLPDSAELYFGEFKLERGNKATDWTPAPEDVQGQIDGLSSGLAGANTTINQIISANIAEQAAIDAQILNLNSALSSLSTGVGENNTSTQGAIDAINAMIATLEAQRSALSDKVASLEQAKMNTDNYIQIGWVKLSNGDTVFGVAVGKDVDILNPDGTISTFERSMTATTSNEFMILTGGSVVGVFDATGMTSESVKVNKIVMGNRFAWSMTPSQMMVLKKGG